MTELRQVTLTDRLQGALILPRQPTDLGVLVLAGSSGRVDLARAGLFAASGATVIAQRWFGGDGQTAAIQEVPLEIFAEAMDRLRAEGCSRIAIVGTSKGAEAALLCATVDSRVSAVVAISPPSVVWAGLGAEGDGTPAKQRSSWTLKGKPLPFVPYDTMWKQRYRDGLVSFRSYYEQSLETFAAYIPDAAIPIERAAGDIMLVAGSDDALWPSDLFARSLADRLAKAGRDHVLVLHPKAGHRVLLPGETTPRSARHAHGGNDDADRELGRTAWNTIAARLGFRP